MNPQNQIDIRLPWRKVQDRLLLRPGETSLWFGTSGCGKSMVARHILLGALSDGHRCYAAALEYRPQDWMCRLVRQASTEARPTEACVHKTIQAMGDLLWLYSAPGAAQADAILDAFTGAAQHHGVRLFLIDSYIRLAIAGDDDLAHQQIMGRISRFARDLNVHVMVVAHTRKTEHSESYLSGKSDVHGSGAMTALTDLADTVVEIWRNRPKERGVEGGLAMPDLLAELDCLLVTHKQRSGVYKPIVQLWFDRASQQYVGNPGERPVPMLQTAKGVATSDNPLPRPPARLWLQWNGDAAAPTWTDEPVSGQDIEYVRAILSPAAVAELRQRIKNVLNHESRLGKQGCDDLAEALALLPEAD